METMNARDFMNTMENLIKSPNQKLIGNINGGYVYAENDQPTLMYAAAEINKANREIETIKTILARKKKISDSYSLPIKRVIFNEPATIIFWDDGSKTVVKAKNEAFDPEKGLAMAIAKKALGNRGSYYNKIKKWTKDYSPACVDVTNKNKIENISADKEQNIQVDDEVLNEK